MNSSVIGALVGGGVGYLAGGWLKHPLVGLAVGVVGGAMVGGGVAAAALPPGPGAPGNGTIILSATDPAMSVGLATGSPVTISLPPGAAWTSGNQTPTNAGTNGSVTWNYSGPGVLILDWTDSAGQPHETTLTLFNA